MRAHAHMPQQDIAARGCFAAAMLSELGPLLEEQGLPGYAAAHAECGALGQVRGLPQLGSLSPCHLCAPLATQPAVS